MAGKKKVVGKAASVEAVEVEKAVAAVKELKIPSVVDSIGKMRVQLSGELDKAQSTIVGLLETKSNLEVSIAAHEARLKELYDVEAAQVQVDELVASIEELKQDHARIKSELLIERNREQSEFDYQLGIRRRKEQDTYNDAQSLRERSWKEREVALKASETEVAELRGRLAGLDDEIKKASAREVAIATNSLKREYETRELLALKDKENQVALHAAEIKSLNANVANLTAQNDKLTKDLTLARAETATVATKGYEAMAGAKALEAIQNGQRNSEVASAKR
jgi:colicin import membrane protein